eukprot:gnl/Dysnectes_brevis/2699_a3274_723.p1 GENE.gnl/Dysnectes_brevis/2699_a3274_723~~gnl/Dysnectes_brevis/2699_a3274_723.p1  ORF type:complete len:675 (-),score=248.26 gnl/Dysnectes_brevis/2699_a3274_723:24-1769(-)
MTQKDAKSIEHGVSKVQEVRGVTDLPLPKNLQTSQARTTIRAETKRSLAKWDPYVREQMSKEHISFGHIPKTRITARSLGSVAKLPGVDTTIESEVNALLKDAGLDQQSLAMTSLPEVQVSKEELMAQRSEQARLRARIAYQEEKLRRWSKIKSKGFRKVHGKDKRNARRERLTSRLAELRRVVGDNDQDVHVREQLAEARGSHARRLQQGLAGKLEVELDREEELRLEQGDDQVDGSDSSHIDDPLASLGGTGANDTDGSADKDKDTGVMSLSFMRKAAEKQRADAAAALRDLDSEEEEGVGRAVFGDLSGSRQRAVEEQEQAKEDVQSEDPSEDVHVQAVKVITAKAPSSAPVPVIASQPKQSALAATLASGVLLLNEEEEEEDSEPSHKHTVNVNPDVAEAFGQDDHIEHSKSEHSDGTQEEEEEDGDAPGWGSWTGLGSKKKAKRSFKAIARERARKTEHVEKRRRRANISRGVPAAACAMQAWSLPRGVKDVAGLRTLAETPLGPEWQSAGDFRKANRLAVEVRPGAVVSAAKFTHHAKELRREQQRLKRMHQTAKDQKKYLRPSKYSHQRRSNKL